MPTHPLEAVDAAIQHLRDSQDHFLTMAKEVRPSPSDVHSHVCREVAEVNENLIDIVDAIEDVLILQKSRLDGHDSDVAALQADVADLQTRMTTAEGRLDVQKARINSIVAYLVEAEKKLKVSESGLAPLPTGII